MEWKHKDLLDISQLSAEEVRYVLATADYFREINSRPVKVPGAERVSVSEPALVAAGWAGG